MEPADESQSAIVRLEAEIVALRARLPRHSVPPSMILRLEELEEELKILTARFNGAGSDETAK
jgi:hypothetical protein